MEKAPFTGAFLWGFSRDENMETAVKVLAGIAMLMMLFVMWPAYKHWSQNSPKAEKGDWANVVFILGLVILFVALLIMSVQ